MPFVTMAQDHKQTAIAENILDNTCSGRSGWSRAGNSRGEGFNLYCASLAGAEFASSPPCTEVYVFYLKKEKRAILRV